MINNNIIPTRRARFDKSVKWWQRGLIDVENSFYNAEWINLDISQNKSIAEYANKDSKLAFILSIVGLCSFVFIPVCFISLPLSLKAQKIEGKNRQNIHAFRISLTSMVLFAGIIIVSLILKVGLILPSSI